MSERIRRLIALALTVVMLLPVLAGCAVFGIVTFFAMDKEAEA